MHNMRNLSLFRPENALANDMESHFAGMGSVPPPRGLAKGSSETSPVGDEGEFKKIVIGICAMQRKANSKPMRSIMLKMGEFYKDFLDFVIFPEETILNEPVDKWPLCDCLISFHSTDFPLKKAIEYEKLRRPYVLNDLHRQFDLLDRRKVFRTLARAGIDHPRHCVLIRNEKGECPKPKLAWDLITVIGDELCEFADHIEVNGMTFNKPFVEKPVNAEDHNIYIYYPSSVGGGSQRLFRKVNDRSSWYSPVSTVRKEGSYIYEEFIPADGTDVKVYAVGPYYAHAEARKAPGLDGKVERDADGKEVRYPVILSAKEKTIARRVVLAFGQSVCGFDLLRANGCSYVCDVNGFSFVKTSTKYYEDTAKILGNTILRRLASSLSIPWHIPFQDDDPPLVSTPSGKIMELRCVLAVIRHGDRTPKQKMKVAVRDERFWNMFKKYDGLRKCELKLKKPTQLMEILEIVRELLQESLEKRQTLLTINSRDTTKQFRSGQCDEGRTAAEHSQSNELEKCEEAVKTWEQMRAVLEMYGHFSGINRKVQLKYLKTRAEKWSTNGKTSFVLESGKTLQQNADGEDHGPNAAASVPTLFLILKWGGELTTAGVLQAEALGRLFRTLYPGIRRTDGKDSPEDTQGLGFLRLHSTYRHDLKIYSSDEGRVQMTAAAFARGLLALEGELTPILMQMVKSANTDGLLNDDYNARQFQNDIKSFLHSALQEDRDFTPSDYQSLNPSGLRSINNALEFIKNARKMCHEIAGYVQRMCEIIRWHKMNNTERSLYLNETWDLAERRWTKELREFRKPSKNGSGDGFDFDISKIPDIYDNIKYDMEHNPDLCINNEGEFERFYLCVKNMADIVVPQEYGISEESKICIAQRVCTPLLAKIRNDLHRCVQSASNEAGDESLTRLDPRASEGIATPMRHVRTRLYFTSESHIHSLMNLIRYGGLCSPDDKKWQRAMNFLSGVTEFNYMTQLVLMVYEDSRTEEEGGGKQQSKDIKDRFHIELLFSPGLYPCFQTEKERIYESRYSNRHKTSASESSKSAKGSSKQSGANANAASGVENLSQQNCACGEDKMSSIASTLKTNELVDVGTINDFIQNGDSVERKASSSLPQKSHAFENNLEEEGSGRAYRQNSGKSVDDYDDDDTEENAVNLVVLDEVTAAGGGKAYCKGDLARHSPTSMDHPMRKRHATFERDSLKMEGKSHRGGEAKGEGKGTSEIGEERKGEENGNEEMIGLVPNKSAIFARRESDGIEKRQQQKTERSKNCHKQQRTLVKSMSDLFQKLEVEGNSDFFDGITQNANELKLEEGQATVGHGRGEWVKQLVEERKTKEERVQIQHPNGHGDGNGTSAPANVLRIPLSSVFEGISTEGQDPDTKNTNKEEEAKKEQNEEEWKDEQQRSVEVGADGSTLGTTENGTIHSQQSTATIKDEDSEEHNRSAFRRPRFPYRFKHHTVNLLTAATENRLISTDVLMGKFGDKTKRKASSNSVVLSTAVIGVRSSSAPRLQTYNAADELSVNEIRRFWPPLRSLETMHDNLSWQEVDAFLKRMMKNCTPLPSPPKTPAPQFDDSLPITFADKRKLNSTICRLSPMEH